MSVTNQTFDPPTGQRAFSTTTVASAQTGPQGAASKPGASSQAVVPAQSEKPIPLSPLSRLVGPEVAGAGFQTIIRPQNGVSRSLLFRDAASGSETASTADNATVSDELFYQISIRKIKDQEEKIEEIQTEKQGRLERVREYEAKIKRLRRQIAEIRKDKAVEEAAIRDLDHDVSILETAKTAIETMRTAWIAVNPELA